MSNLQYGTLRYLVLHEVDVEQLGIYNLNTLGSLILRGWVERTGSRLSVTVKGMEAYMAYHRGGPNFRQHAGEISDRVRTLLHISKLRTMKAAG